MTDLIYAAAYPLYRDRGWNPIKLRAGIKFPPPAGFTGRDGADPSGADMHAWAEEEPDGNLAIRLPVDVVGIDVDAYDGKTGAQTLAEAEKRWGKLPYSPRSTSRDDGASGIRLYRIPPGVELVGVIDFPELGIGDIEICQRHHRYVMGWPSIHPSGRKYQWLGIDNGPLDEPPAPDDIPELPVAWLEGLRKQHNGAEFGGDGSYDVRQVLTEGQMSRRVAWKLGEATLACQGASRHDHTRDNVLAMLRYGKQGDTGVLPALKALQKAFVAAVGPDRPGGPTQAAAEFGDFVNGERVAALLAQPDYDDWTEGFAAAGEPSTSGDEPGVVVEPSLLELRGVTAAWLAAQQFEPLEYHVDGLITEGLGIFVGPPKKGKSFLVANVGLAVASGGTALGAIPVAQRPVLYLALEDGHRRLKSRFGRILDRAPQPEGLTVVTKASPGEALALIGEFFDRHRDAKPLVILDTLGKARPGRRPGEDAYQTDYALGTKLKNLVDAAPGSCLLVVHHTRKAEALDFVDSVSGTHGIAGSVDFVMVLDRKRHSDDAVLSVTGRDIPEGEYALTADYGILWRLDGRTLTEARHKVAERREKTELGERSLGLLGFVNGRAETTAADVAAKLGFTPKRAGDVLRELYDSGRISRLRRGVYGALGQARQANPESAGQAPLICLVAEQAKQANDD